jgi:DNA polymerase-1
MAVEMISAEDEESTSKSTDNEEIILAIPQLDALAKIDVKHIVEEMPWMKDKKFHLLHERKAIEDFIDRMIAQGIGSLDIETTGLNTRLDSECKPIDTLVGISLGISKDEACYIPIAHADKEYNVSLDFIIDQIKRLAANCKLIFHNFKFDGQFLRNYGVLIGGDSCNDEMYEDTLIMACIQDASRKRNGLKKLSKDMLNREMMEIKGLGVTVSDDSIPAFDQVPPEKAVYYAAADAMNTFYLYEVLTDLINQQDTRKNTGPWIIYKIEKRCMFVTMEMERNYVEIDKDYLIGIKTDLEARSIECVKQIQAIAKRPIDVNSPKQLGIFLFEELKLKYLSKTPRDKTKSGNYETSEKILELIKKDHPVINLILDYRGYQKYISTYVDNLIKNADENNEVKFELNQNRADTGRYSASGGKGLKVDGYCGVNCQNLPKTHEDDPKAVNIRRALKAKPGFKTVTIDYSGEEVRVAANLSKEEKWIKEFTQGSGDLHTVTAKLIYNKNEINKTERGVGKTINFLTSYGGGPGAFSIKAKISFELAKKLMYNFFKQYATLKKWIESEARVCRKRGYSKTVFGRRRPLIEFYNSTDENIQKKGDRCAINASVQGASADLLKISLHRVSKWIREQGLQDKIRLLIPIHDELVFEIKYGETEEDKAAFGHYIEELSKVMVLDDIITSLAWPVHLEVDAEYGDTLSVDHDYFKEKKEMLKNSNTPENTKVIEEVQNQEQAKEVIPTNTVNQTTDFSNQVNVVTTQHPTGSNIGYQFEAKIRSQLMGEDDLNIAKEILLARMKEEPKEVEETIKNDQNLSKFIDGKGYFIYNFANFDTIVAKQADTIINILESVGDKFVGPKCYIKLLKDKNEVIYVSSKSVSIDAFIALCIWLNI